MKHCNLLSLLLFCSPLTAADKQFASEAVNSISPNVYQIDLDTYDRHLEIYRSFIAQREFQKASQYLKLNKVSHQWITLCSKSWKGARFGASKIIETEHYLELQGDIWLSKNNLLFDGRSDSASSIKFEKSTMRIFAMKGLIESFNTL